MTDPQSLAYARARDAFVALSNARAEHESVCKVAQRAADRVLVARKAYAEALSALESFFVPQYDATPALPTDFKMGGNGGKLCPCVCGKPIAGSPSIPCVLPEGHEGECR